LVAVHELVSLHVTINASIGGTNPAIAGLVADNALRPVFFNCPTEVNQVTVGNVAVYELITILVQVLCSIV
jgi:hypothetical protein